MRLIVTGGAGFIGSNFIHRAIKHGHQIINIDCLTYASSITNLTAFQKNKNYSFLKIDIRDRDLVRSAIHEAQPDGLVHLAAESHVDRSIDSPSDFITTNILGTFNLLEAFRDYYYGVTKAKSPKFLHVSTDEVYGSLGNDGLFTENTPYSPNSPYASSKASSDHLARAWYKTYGVPTIISNCSNNYGPFQFPEKLIPVILMKALSFEPIPIYGDGLNVRDWLYVEDHAEALLQILEHGKVGEKYNIGGKNEITNLDLTRELCKILDIKKPGKSSYSNLITFVQDRPGHDRRYAIDSSKIEKELNWKAKTSLKDGLEKTVDWYLENQNWVSEIKSEQKVGSRLGLG